MTAIEVAAPVRRDQMRRFVALTGTRALATLASGVWLVLAARHLSLDEFGTLSMMLALVVIFTNASDAGVQIVLADHVARAGAIERRVLALAMRRRVLVGSVCALVVTALYLAAVADRSLSIPLCFAASMLATVAYQTVLTAYRATGRIAADGLTDLLSRAGVLLLGVAVLLAGAGLPGAAAVYAATDVLALGVVVAVISRKRLIATTTSSGLPDLSARHTLPLAIGVTVWVVYLRVDMYLLTILAGPSDAALYGAANRFLDVALLPAVVLGHTVLAYVSPLGGRARLAEVHRYVAAAAGIAVLAATVGTAVSPMVLAWFGSEYSAAQRATVILLASAVPGALVATLVPVAGISNRRRFGWIASGALLGNVLANVAVIPRYGIEGAAAVTLVSQAAFAGCLYWIVRGGIVQSDLQDAPSVEFALSPANVPSTLKDDLEW